MTTTPPIASPLTSRENVRRAIQFATPAWLPRDFPGNWGSDFAMLASSKPSPDDRPSRGVDEWGAVWENLGTCNVGEVKQVPLQDWGDFAALKIPDIRDPRRWEALAGVRARAGDRFLVGFGISLYERVHFIRGLENTWMDIHTNPTELRALIDILVDMNLVAIEHYAAAGVDGLFLLDDWGLQQQLMIAPAHWRALWKPAYARIFAAAHAAGLLTILHSCGYIVDILDDLIEIGLDVIQLDQQANMGLELLGQRFGGRLTFFAPVDIQVGMQGSTDDVRAYARRMVDHLARPTGGFIPRWYADPRGAGHRQEHIDAMCAEFLAISREMYGREGQA